MAFFRVGGVAPLDGALPPRLNHMRAKTAKNIAKRARGYMGIFHLIGPVRELINWQKFRLSPLVTWKIFG